MFFNSFKQGEPDIQIDRSIFCSSQDGDLQAGPAESKDQSGDARQENGQSHPVITNEHSCKSPPDTNTEESKTVQNAECNVIEGEIENEDKQIAREEESS